MAWLSTRQPTPPSGLAERLRDIALPPGGTRSARLARAGVELLDRVVHAPADGRPLAADLLAADALVTYAFEAQAEEDLDGLPALADEVARTATTGRTAGRERGPA